MNINCICRWVGMLFEIFNLAKRDDNDDECNDLKGRKGKEKHDGNCKKINSIPHSQFKDQRQLVTSSHIGTGKRKFTCAVLVNESFFYKSTSLPLFTVVLRNYIFGMSF